MVPKTRNAPRLGPVVEPDGAACLALIRDNLRQDARFATYVGATDCEVRFTISSIEARAVANEIDRLQSQDAMPAPDCGYHDAAPPEWPFYALFGLMVLALPVTLWVLQ